MPNSVDHQTHKNIREKEENNKKIANKIIGISKPLSVIALNVNKLNSLIYKI